MTRITAAAQSQLRCCVPVIPSWSFSEAFGVDQPSGIRELRIWRHYEGGPGEHSLIFEFTADEDAIRNLTASFPKNERNSQYPATWGEVAQKFGTHNAWMSAYELYGGAYHASGRGTWARLKPLDNPEILFVPASQQNKGKSILVLWDRSSGRTVVLHSRG